MAAYRQNFINPSYLEKNYIRILTDLDKTWYGSSLYFKFCRIAGETVVFIFVTLIYHAAQQTDNGSVGSPYQMQVFANRIRGTGNARVSSLVPRTACEPPAQAGDSREIVFCHFERAEGSYSYSF